MKKFIKTYKNVNEKRMNYGLINRETDHDLVEYIIDCCKSLEVLKYVKFLGYEYITDVSEINANEYIDARSRGKAKKKDASRYMYLKDSRYAELRLKFHLECDDEEDTIVKKLLVPIPDDRGYYTIKGTPYYLMYQIVDNSTYTTKKTLTLKSMMPVILKMKPVMYESVDGDKYSAPTYTINIFKKDADIMLFYMAKMGIENTLEYFAVDKIMRFTNTIDANNKEFIYFPISSKMFLEVNRYFFEKYVYTRTIAFMFLNIVTNRLTFDILHNKYYWIEAIGSLGTVTKTNQYEKGLNTLTYFDRMIDDTTKRILKVHPINKKDTYAILRWLVMNFNSLRKKDNLDLNNKRLRCNEYIASLLTKAFSERVKICS